MYNLIKNIFHIADGKKKYNKNNWKNNSKGQAAWIGWGGKKRGVSSYISNYVFENGKLPIGKHLIDINTSHLKIHDFKVDFDEVVLKTKD